jgi:carbon monoxide dehydrogenase subunit G
MAITVPFDLKYEFTVKARPAEVFAVLSDVPASASHFPKVAKLVDLGGGAYRWEMEKVGTDKINIQTVYASKYVSDKRKGTVVWTPVKGEGNALISGNWTITDKKKSTQLALEISGELNVPLPGLMKMIVAPVILGENERLIERYVANLTKHFGGAA